MERSKLVDMLDRIDGVDLTLKAAGWDPKDIIIQMGLWAIHAGDLSQISGLLREVIEPEKYARIGEPNPELPS